MAHLKKNLELSIVFSWQEGCWFSSINQQLLFLIEPQFEASARRNICLELKIQPQV